MSACKTLALVSVAPVAKIIEPNIAVSSSKPAMKNRKQWYVYNKSLNSKISENLLFTNQTIESEDVIAVLNVKLLLSAKKLETPLASVSSRPSVTSPAEGYVNHANPTVSKTPAKVGFKTSSIITKINKIAIAPTYTIRNRKAKNSAPTYRYSSAPLKKTAIRHNKLCTGCFKKMIPRPKPSVRVGRVCRKRGDQACATRTRDV